MRLLRALFLDRARKREGPAMTRRDGSNCRSGRVSEANAGTAT
jgi:hypothetical protein